MASHVIKNFKFTKEKIEEFNVVKILDSEDVILEMPLGVHEFNQTFEYPIVFGEFQGIAMIQEAETVMERTKMFFLKNLKEDEETKTVSVIECTEKEATTKVRLPRDTKVEELVLINGKVFWAQKVEKPKEETPLTE